MSFDGLPVVRDEFYQGGHYDHHREEEIIQGVVQKGQ
jgi:hypothetical protein